MEDHGRGKHKLLHEDESMYDMQIIDYKWYAISSILKKKISTIIQ